MSEKLKCEQGLLYDANNDEQLLSDRLRCKTLCQKLNNSSLLDSHINENILKEIVNNIGKQFNVTIPFQCDYGYNIFIGDNFYSNHNLIILDAAKVIIGNNVFIGPNCSICTSGHPIDYIQRNKGLEFAQPIIIEDNVWIGANVTILPNVTIKSGAVIGAGSVVCKDISNDCVALGNPCKVIKKSINKI